MTNLLLRNATLLLMNEAREVLRGDLRIAGGEIAEIAEKIEPREGERVEDLGGDYVLPGFVQTHVHLCQALFRHEAEGRPLLRWLQERIWPLEGAHNHDSMVASAELGLAELLLSGTTCLLDMGTTHNQEAIFEVADRWGVRGAFGKAMMDVGDNVPHTLRETTEDSLKESVALAERWHGHDNDRIRYALAPRFALSCSEELQRRVGELSRERGWLIHTHASEHEAEVAAIVELHGERNVELLHGLGMTGPRSVFAHCVHLDDGEHELLRSTDTSVAHCPSSNLKLGSGIADVVRLLGDGVNVGIGVDGAPCNNSLDAFIEMRLAHLLQGPRHGAGALSPWEVLEMATWRGAKALGWADKIGRLRVGYEADLIRVRRSDPRLGLGSDPAAELVGAGMRDLIRDVWVRGRRLVQDSALVDHDLGALLERGTAALGELWERLEASGLAHRD